MGQARRPLTLKEYRRVTLEKRTVKITGLRRAKGTGCWKSCVIRIKVHSITCLEGTEGGEEI
jgi:hypothetical protein